MSGDPAAGGEGAAALVPAGAGIRALREAAAGCRACSLWRRGTQTVFGSGPARADIMLVGEQPGDKEDVAGVPFVGPAGKLLDRALAEAGIDPGRTYKTNAVKHFKWEARGKRRIHQKPSKLEIDACRPWLEAELERVEPTVVGVLGATAAKALLGSSFRVTRERGRRLQVDFAPCAVATIHPSAVLRGPPEQRDEAFSGLVSDLEIVAAAA